MSVPSAFWANSNGYTSQQVNPFSMTALESISNVMSGHAPWYLRYTWQNWNCREYSVGYFHTRANTYSNWNSTTPSWCTRADPMDSNSVVTSGRWSQSRGCHDSWCGMCQSDLDQFIWQFQSPEDFFDSSRDSMNSSWSISSIALLWQGPLQGPQLFVTSATLLYPVLRNFCYNHKTSLCIGWQENNKCTVDVDYSWATTRQLPSAALCCLHGLRWLRISFLAIGVISHTISVALCTFTSSIVSTRSFPLCQCFKISAFNAWNFETSYDMYFNIAI